MKECTQISHYLRLVTWPGLSCRHKHIQYANRILAEREPDMSWLLKWIKGVHYQAIKSLSSATLPEGNNDWHLLSSKTSSLNRNIAHSSATPPCSCLCLARGLVPSCIFIIMSLCLCSYLNIPCNESQTNNNVCVGVRVQSVALLHWVRGKKNDILTSLIPTSLKNILLNSFNIYPIPFRY